MSKPLNLVIGNAKISYQNRTGESKVAEAKNNQTPDVSEQDKIRRGKLADLQAAGNDPFG